MRARIIGINEKKTEGDRAAACRRRRHRRTSRALEEEATEPYRLDVITSSVADVIASAGGWLFDQALAGWHVNVYAASRWDVRPLQILGIGAKPYEWEVTTKPSQTQALAVSAEVFVRDDRVREHIVLALDSGLMDLTVWGDTEHLQVVAYHLESTKHRLSAAARVFKEASLVAAAVRHNPVALTESFVTVHPGVVRPADIWC